MIGFNDDSFSELILHPPPVSLFSLLILPLMIVKPLVKPLNKAFSYLVFWGENFVMLSIFFIYSLLLLPIVCGKIFFNLMFSGQGLFTVIFYCLVWIFSGLFFTFGLLVRDLTYLFGILAMHQGCRQAMGLPDELKEIIVDPDVKLKVYNEVRRTAIELFLELRKQALSTMGLPPPSSDHMMDPSSPQFDMDELDVLDMLDNVEEQLKGADCFMLKYTVIHDEWSKRRKKTVQKVGPV